MEDKKSLNFVNAPKALSDFEKDCFDDISALNIEGWNIWQITKLVVFYDRINTTTAPSTSNQPAKENAFHKATRFTIALTSAFTNILTLLFKTQKRKTTFFVTNSADKLVKNSQGLFYNPLVYPIVDTGLIKDFLIWETPSNQGFLAPSAHPYQVNTGSFSYLSSKLSKFQRSKSIEDTCVKFTLIFNQYLTKKGFTDQVSVHLIKHCVFSFLSDLKLYRKIFTITPPALVISSERMTTGFLAAAIEKSIPVIELQHGSIDEYYPPYCWDARFVESAKIMKPYKLVVFGQLAQSIVLKNAYFKTDEIFKLGYQKIDKIRELYRKEELKSNSEILVVVQPFMHELNLGLLKELLSLQLKYVMIHVKVHPLQNKEEVDEYISLAAGTPLKIIDGKHSIHELISGTDMVLGYFSTVLEESISLGKPTITICTKDTPKGIHSFTGSEELVKAIRAILLPQLNTTLQHFFTDETYRQKWLSDVKECEYKVYEKNYQENLKRLLKPFIS